MIQQHKLKPEKYLYNKKGTTSTFHIDIKKGECNKCPIPGCVGSSRDKFRMYRHFCFRHNDAELIIKGGNLDADSNSVVTPAIKAEIDIDGETAFP